MSIHIHKLQIAWFVFWKHFGNVWKSMYLLKYIRRVYAVNKILQRGAKFTIHKIGSEKFRGKRRLSMKCFWPVTFTLLKIRGNSAIPFQPC